MRPKGGRERLEIPLFESYFFNSTAVLYHLRAVEEAPFLRCLVIQLPFRSPPFLHLHVVFFFGFVYMDFCFTLRVLSAQYREGGLKGKGRMGPQIQYSEPGARAFPPPRETVEHGGRALRSVFVSSMKRAAS